MSTFIRNSTPARMLPILALLASGSRRLTAQEMEPGAGDPPFPTRPVPVVEGAFARSEGIAFNAEGRLFVAGDRALWEVGKDGSVRRLAEMYSNLGLAPIGERDILMADFGPTNRFDHGPNGDGIVWRVTPEGEATRVVDGGIGDPNFILVLPDGSFLVSDDATHEIFRATLAGELSLFTSMVPHPNGMVLSADGSSLYVAQSFQQIQPYVLDDRLWAVPLSEGLQPGEPRLVARTGERALNDGLAMDIEGRIYIAANVQGAIWRFDPRDGELVLVAEGMPGAGSLAFGRGEFDHASLYVTSTRTGTVWAVKVGTRGSPLQH